jgi:hypothetical protein
LGNVLEGIVPGDEASARDWIRYLAAQVEGTFAPEIGDALPAGGDNPEAPAVAAEESESSDAGQ